MRTIESKVEKNQPNYWKYAFLVLSGLLLGGLLYLGVQMNTPRDVATREKIDQTIFEDKPSLQVATNKEDINRIINHYLEKYLSNSSVKYDFYLENQALLNGTFHILGVPVEFYLYFEPFVMNNGDVLLQAKSVSIGSLNLPMSFILSQVTKMDLPSWVSVNAEEENVTLHLSELVIEDDIRIKADKINLIDDDIRLNVYFDVKDKVKE